MSSNNRFTFPSVPISFILLLVVSTGIYWLFNKNKNFSPPSLGSIHGETMKLIRIPGGTLTTNGLVKTETISKSDENEWRGTTSSTIRVDATYRYEVKLRGDWKLGLDDQRKVAFVIAPRLSPQLPVAIDSKTIYEETSSGWARWDKHDHLDLLRRELSPYLEKKATSQDYINVIRGEARKTVEEFIRDWIIRKYDGDKNASFLIVVYFEDDNDIIIPSSKSLNDFIP